MTQARFNPFVSGAIPVALLWIALSAGVGNAAERALVTRGPKLEGDVYKCAVRIDWKGTGEKECPDLTKGIVHVFLFTFTPGPREGTENVGKSYLKSTVHPEGVILFDLPKGMLREDRRQTIAVSIQRIKDFRFRAEEQFPVSPATADSLPMPLLVPLKAIRSVQVKVQVVSDLDGKPVPNEPVLCFGEDPAGREAWSSGAKTGADGVATLTVDDDRAYTLQTIPRRGAQIGEVTVKQEDLASLKGPVVLRSTAPRITGRVLIRSEAGELRPLEGPKGELGARVDFSGIVQGEIADGNYRIYRIVASEREGLVPGVYWFFLPLDKFYSGYVIADGAPLTIDASMNPPVKHDLVLKRSARATLSVAVVDEETGKPVENAQVGVGPLYGDPKWTVATDPNGQIKLENVPEGDYRVEAKGERHRRRASWVHLVGDQRQELRLARMTGLTVTVKDRSGAPLAGATVLALPRTAGEGQPRQQERQTDAHGAVTFKDLGRGECDLMVAVTARQRGEAMAVYAGRITLVADKTLAVPAGQLTPVAGRLTGEVSKKPRLYAVIAGRNLLAGIAVPGADGAFSMRLLPNKYEAYASADRPGSRKNIVRVGTFEVADKEGPPLALAIPDGAEGMTWEKMLELPERTERRPDPTAPQPPRPSQGP